MVDREVNFLSFSVDGDSIEEMIVWLTLQSARTQVGKEPFGGAVFMNDINAAYDLSRADLVPCDGDENVGGVRAGRGGRGDLVAADADGDVAERAQGPDDLADAVAGGLLQVA